MHTGPREKKDPRQLSPTSHRPRGEEKREEEVLMLLFLLRFLIRTPFPSSPHTFACVWPTLLATQVKGWRGAGFAHGQHKIPLSLES